jgi:hypothetical protein
MNVLVAWRWPLWSKGVAINTTYIISHSISQLCIWNLYYYLFIFLIFPMHFSRSRVYIGN